MKLAYQLERLFGQYYWGLINPSTKLNKLYATGGTIDRFASFKARSYAKIPLEHPLSNSSNENFQLWGVL